MNGWRRSDGLVGVEHFRELDPGAEVWESGSESRDTRAGDVRHVG